jgi:ribosomal protein S1
MTSEYNQTEPNQIFKGRVQVLVTKNIEDTIYKGINSTVPNSTIENDLTYLR